MRTEKERLSGDCNRDNQGRIGRKARTKRGLKIIDVRVSLSAAQMNPHTDFSMNDDLIDICFLAVTAYVILPHSKWSRKIWQPCDVRVIVVSIVADNTLLCRLRVLHPKKLWIFCPIERIESASLRPLRLASNKRSFQSVSSLSRLVLFRLLYSVSFSTGFVSFDKFRLSSLSFWKLRGETLIYKMVAVDDF